MSCKHKFYEELQLVNLDYEPEVLIVGTFNPSWPKSNYAEWFYGRTDANFFWDVLPRIYEGKSLLCSDVSEWKAFCKRNKIAITDLICEIKNLDSNNLSHKKLLSGYGDKEIMLYKDNFELNSIDKILEYKKSIRKIYFTRGMNEGWSKQWDKAYKKKSIKVVELFTPSRYASYSVSSWRKKEANIDKPMSIPNYIIGRWSEKFHIESKVVVDLG